MYLRVSAPAERLRVTDAKLGGQGETIRAEGQRLEGQKGRKSKSGSSQLAGLGPELEDK